jgi:hypothetical protein
LHPHSLSPRLKTANGRTQERGFNLGERECGCKAFEDLGEFGAEDDLATSVVYLLDITTVYVPAPILCAKFSQILEGLAGSADLPLRVAGQPVCGGDSMMQHPGR